MKNIVLHSLLSFCVASFLSTSLSAQEEVDIHIKVIPNNERIQTEEDLCSDCVAQKGYHYDDAYVCRLHINSFNHLYGFNDDGSQVEMLDGSKWNIVIGRYKVVHWAQSNEIFIKPAYFWYTSTKYVLYNRTLNQTVEADLCSCPYSDSLYTYKITYIDHFNKLIILSDNTVWQMGLSANFKSWQIGDRILIGVNNYWRTTASPQILINVEIAGAPYCPAIHYGYSQQ